MTTTEMREWFDILEDKYNTPNFTTAEVDEFIFDAQWGIINKIIGDFDTPSALENDKAAMSALSTLIKPATVATDINGVILNTHAGFVDMAAAQAAPVIVLSLELASGVPLHHVRHSHIGKYEDNTYKAGTATYPNYTLIATGYQTYPALNATSVEAVYLAEPTAIDDLPVRMHRKLIATAMTKTGYVIESQALTMMEQVTNG